MQSLECNLGSWEFVLWLSQTPPFGARMQFTLLDSCHVSNLHSTSFLLCTYLYHFWELVTSPYLGYELDNYPLNFASVRCSTHMILVVMISAFI
jgi:hypothetical protein